VVELGPDVVVPVAAAIVEVREGCQGGRVGGHGTPVGAAVDVMVAEAVPRVEGDQRVLPQCAGDGRALRRREQRMELRGDSSLQWAVGELSSAMGRYASRGVRKLQTPVFIPCVI
jgi:hypothetical protein